ncbi:LysM peptidoglycan-binding domain-containing protein [Vibrio sp.]|uniref:LysM peptidoglycan-binding domain-containing protein n=1 Tax=Vibrio sp. TaxID=678 RepID=UPI003D113214
MLPENASLFMRNRLRMLSLLLMVLSSGTALAAQPAAAQHQVSKGDTLWDIAAQHWQDPWQWPALWKLNPHIDDPDLIYPGTTLHLSSLGVSLSSPVTVQRQRKLRPTIHFQPTVGTENAAELSAEVILLSPERIAQAVKVAAGDDERELLSGLGDITTIARFDADKGAVYRQMGQFQRGSYQVIALVRIADVEPIQSGETSSRMAVSRVRQEIRRGDLVLSLPPRSEPPRLPLQLAAPQQVSIIGSVNARHLSQTQGWLVLDRGLADGLQTGSRFDIVPASPSDSDAEPSRLAGKIGLLTVLRSYDYFSLARIEHSLRPIKPNARLQAH